jgi:hypothetical protein
VWVWVWYAEDWGVLVDEFIDWLMEGLMNGLIDIGDGWRLRGEERRG